MTQQAKNSYPNYDQYMYTPGQHDTQKWLAAVRQIYHLEQNGFGRIQAVRQTTSEWKPMEVNDFLNWLKFYEGGNHMKYKTAQLWYENPSPSYLFNAPKPPSEHSAGHNIDFAKQQSVMNGEKRQLIEKQRNKIVGRLDSAEKLLRSPEGHTFAGDEFEQLLETIYQLKKKIQMVNKISTSNRLYHDMIVREANILTRKGFAQASNFLYKIAQAGEIPTAAPPNFPTQSTGFPSGLPSMGPGMPQNAPSDSAPETGPNELPPTNLKGVDNKPAPTVSMGPPPPIPQKDPNAIKSPALLNFLKNLDEGTNVELNESDTLEVDDDLLVSEAQIPPAVLEDVPMTSSPAPAPRNPTAPIPIKEKIKSQEEPLEVVEQDAEPLEVESDEPIEADTKDFDQRVEQVFSQITVKDVVAKLEDLAKVFKTREIPRQLGVVDMMLDSLGLSTYFPSLSEATNKALESNNYISTRIEDILSKLRGAMKTRDIDLKGNEIDRPDVAGIKGKLQEDTAKDKARKQQRKEQEMEELMAPKKESPEVEMGELGQSPTAPVKVPAPQVAPTV